jgi:hypothetical protein
VLVLAVAIGLAVVSVATFPCWSYSAQWGYGPSAVAGTLLLCVAMIVVGGKSAPKAAEPDISVASTSLPISFHGAPRNVETVHLQQEAAPP